MKKNAILLSLLIIINLSICAQDTISDPAGFGGVLNPYPTIKDPSTTWYDCSSPGLEFAIEFNNIDKITTKVYGVAGVVVSNYECQPYYDSIATIEDYSECFEYGRMYRLNLDGDSLIVVGEGIIDVLDSNVIGYFDFSSYEDIVDSDYQPFHDVLPIRATYFEQPILIDTTFFVGITQLQYAHHRRNTIVIADLYSGDSNLNTFLAVYGLIANHRNEWYFERIYGGINLLFPLLDTMPMYASPLVSGGSSAEAPVVTMESFVSVSPNPTTGTATVKSSFGIDEVELYDLGGAPLLRQRASGLTHTLDLQALPIGTYILKVHTPYGTTTKKLIKQ